MFYLSDWYISFYVDDVKISISYSFISTMLIVFMLWKQSKLIELSNATLGQIQPSFKSIKAVQLLGIVAFSYWLVINIMKYI